MAMFKAMLVITRGYQYTGKSSNQPTTFENLTRAVLDKASVGNDIWRKSHVAHFAQQLVLDKHGPCDEKVHPPKKKTNSPHLLSYFNKKSCAGPSDRLTKIQSSFVQTFIEFHGQSDTLTTSKNRIPKHTLFSAFT